jgi:hypothetical protein
MEYENSTNNMNQTNSEHAESKKYLINDDKFDLIKQCQQEVFTATESRPSIRKIINELITEENLQEIKSKFIAIWKF